jgi:hypothetical protein
MKAKIFTGAPRTGKTRVANMISEHIGKEKTFWVTAKNIKGRVNGRPFLFEGITDKTELIIFDDCPINFDFSCFFPVEDNTPYGGDLKFRLTVKEPKKKIREILIPQIIFTTEKLDPKWKDSGASFNGRFDIVEFPLSK